MARPGPAPLPPVERWADVIGVEDYQSPAIAPLRYAVADARAVHDFLTQRLGFKLLTLQLLVNKWGSLQKAMTIQAGSASCLQNLRR